MAKFVCWLLTTLFVASLAHKNDTEDLSDVLESIQTQVDRRAADPSEAALDAVVNANGPGGARLLNMVSSGTRTIWCKGKQIFCTSSTSANGAKIFQGACHGYCFPSSCKSHWAECVEKRNKKAAMCNRSTDVNCIVPVRHQPIAEDAARKMLDEIIQTFDDKPDLQHLVGDNRDKIINSLIHGTDIDEYLDKNQLLEHFYPPNNGTRRLRGQAVGQCANAVISTSVDALGCILWVTGLQNVLKTTQMRQSGLRVWAQRVRIEGTPQRPIFGFTRLEQITIDMTEATGRYKGWKKAHAVLQFLEDMRNVLGVREIMKMIRGGIVGVSIWRWIGMAVQIIIQLIAWCTTGGYAFIAELSLIVWNIVSLVDDAADIGKYCYAHKLL